MTWVTLADHGGDTLTFVDRLGPYLPAAGTCPLFRGLIFFWGAMNRYVVMVDAGYLLRQSIEIISNRVSKRRVDLEIPDPAGLIQAILTKSRELLALDGKELLRVYWYDGVNPGGLTPQQRSLVEVDDVQFRAGTVNAAKQQKGVDSLIVTDLIELTSHHAMCDAILITGDSDLAVGIEIAQRRGVRIAVLGVEDLAQGVAHHQSFEITSRADRVGRLGAAELTPCLRYKPQPVAPVIPLHASLSGMAISVGIASTAGSAPGKSSSAAVAEVEADKPLRNQPAALTASDKAALLSAVTSFIASEGPFGDVVDAATSRIDQSIDRALIHYVFERLETGALTNPQKVYARHVFRSSLATAASGSSEPSQPPP